MIAILSIQKSTAQPLRAAQGFCECYRIFSILIIMIMSCAAAFYSRPEQKAISMWQFANRRGSSGGGVSYQQCISWDIFHRVAHRSPNQSGHSILPADRGLKSCSRENGCQAFSQTSQFHKCP